MREVDLSGLPTKNHCGKNCIDWSNSVGYKISFTYNDISGIFEIVNYLLPEQLLEIKYIDTLKTIKTKLFIKGHIGSLIGKITKDFKVDIGCTFTDLKRNITIIDREYNLGVKKYKYKCNVCGYSNGWIQESNLLTQKGGCSCCSGMVVVEGINDIPTTASWMVKYFQGGYDEAKLYTKRSSKKFYPICPDCSKIKTKPMNINTLYQAHSIGCTCGSGKSYPHKFMAYTLDQLNIQYIDEYSPKWIGKKRFDFYLPTYKIILEMDGYFHKKPYSKNTTTEKSLNIDIWKDKQAIEHGLKVIRIDANESTLEYLSENIKLSIGNIISLCNVDWLQCDIEATKNKIKEVCEYFETKKPITTSTLAEIFKISNSTVSKYLKKGNTFNWCQYDPKEALTNNYETLKKKIAIYKNNICLGVYSSCHDLEKYSIKDFGIALKQSSISPVANGKRTEYKGYTFKYV